MFVCLCDSVLIYSSAVGQCGNTNFDVCVCVVCISHVVNTSVVGYVVASNVQIFMFFFASSTPVDPRRFSAARSPSRPVLGAAVYVFVSCPSRRSRRSCVWGAAGRRPHAASPPRRRRPRTGPGPCVCGGGDVWRGVWWGVVGGKGGRQKCAPGLLGRPYHLHFVEGLRLSLPNTQAHVLSRRLRSPPPATPTPLRTFGNGLVLYPLRSSERHDFRRRTARGRPRRAWPAPQARGRRR